VNIWSLELDETGRPTSEALRAFDSSKTELCPAFSPDGTRVALESNRLGTDEIWVCTSNMSCSKLTSFAGPHAGSPAWSPDGQWIAFDGLGDTGSGIYTIRSDGGPLHRLADGSAPRWSRDGRWIYYSNGIAAQLYRIASSGGEPVALGGPGWVPQESADGWVYYSLSPNADATTLRRTRPAGGEASDVLSESVAGRNFVVVDGGIWYLTPYTRAQGSLLRFYDFATETTRTVFRTERPVAPGMTLAPDGRRILFTQLDRHGSDLMLIENFR
jgi:Tol biopolymer transport system component